MQTVVERLWSSKFAVFSPDTFLSTIWKLFPSLAGFKQQDSDELLRFMLDRFRLEEEQMAELQVDNTRVKSMSSSTLPKKNDRDRQQQGFIDQLFGGTIVHQVFCQKCHQISRQEDNFYGLFSLEIPRIYRSLTHTNGSKSSGGGGGYSSGRRSRRPSQEDPSSGSDSIGSGGNGGRGSAAASKCHLTNCLDAIIEEEQLKEDAQYFCSKCQKKCDAVRQSCLSKIPNIVIFHINRTDWINGCKKIQSFVEFPLTLDLTKYEKTPSSFISSSNTTGTLATPSSRSTSGQYTLRSMIVHDGKSMSQGHYTSFAYNSVLKQWCHFNDHRVKFVDWQEVSKQQAYLLIYGRTSSLPLSRDSTPMPFNSSSSPVQFPPCTTASALAPRRSPRTSLPPSSMAECSFVPPLSLDSAPARKTRKSSFNYS
jgi:ubiquitin C-terminal hydrolase